MYYLLIERIIDIGDTDDNCGPIGWYIATEITILFWLGWTNNNVRSDAFVRCSVVEYEISLVDSNLTRSTYRNHCTVGGHGQWRNQKVITPWCFTIHKGHNLLVYIQELLDEWGSFSNTRTRPNNTIAIVDGNTIMVRIPSGLSI